MDKPIMEGMKPAVFLLPDQTELEVAFVELYDDEFEYKENEREYLRAVKHYIARIAKSP